MNIELDVGKMISKPVLLSPWPHGYFKDSLTASRHKSLRWSWSVAIGWMAEEKRSPPLRISLVEVRVEIEGSFETGAQRLVGCH